MDPHYCSFVGENGAEFYHMRVLEKKRNAAQSYRAAISLEVAVADMQS